MSEHPPPPPRASPGPPVPHRARPVPAPPHPRCRRRPAHGPRAASHWPSAAPAVWRTALSSNCRRSGRRVRRAGAGLCWGRAGGWRGVRLRAWRVRAKRGLLARRGSNAGRKGSLSAVGKQRRAGAAWGLLGAGVLWGDTERVSPLSSLTLWLWAASSY